MPLYNLMDRGLRLPRIGTIRKGVQVPVMDGDKPKKKDGVIVTRPKEMPHWIFKCAESTTDPNTVGEIEKAIYQAYGTNQVKSLNVFLGYPDAFTNFSFWLEAYNFNQLIARSDERFVTYLFDVESNEILVKDGQVIAHSTKPKSAAGKLVAGIAIGNQLPHSPDMILGQAKNSEKAITFKAVGRLTVVIRELKRLATFTMITGGYWYDIPQIYSTIQIIDQITQATGRGANTIPLTLSRVEREGTFTAEDGSKKKRLFHDVQLEIRSDITAGLLETYNDSPFALAIANQQPVLPEKVTDVIEEDYATTVEEPTEEEVTMVEPTDPLSKKAVEWTATTLNMDKDKAAIEIKRLMNQGRVTNPMERADFKKLIESLK